MEDQEEFCPSKPSQRSESQNLSPVGKWGVALSQGHPDVIHIRGKNRQLLGSWYHTIPKAPKKRPILREVSTIHQLSSYDKQLYVMAYWQGHQARALVDGGAQIDIISTEFLNLARIPWRKKKEPVAIRGPFPIQEVSRETEWLEITVKGRTTSVVFDIVDMSSNKSMGIILGRPWYASYDPDIDRTR